MMLPKAILCHVIIAILCLCCWSFPYVPFALNVNERQANNLLRRENPDYMQRREINDDAGSGGGLGRWTVNHDVDDTGSGGDMEKLTGISDDDDAGSGGGLGKSKDIEDDDTGNWQYSGKSKGKEGNDDTGSGRHIDSWKDHGDDDSESREDDDYTENNGDLDDTKGGEGVYNLGNNEDIDESRGDGHKGKDGNYVPWARLPVDPVGTGRHLFRNDSLWNRLENYRHHDILDHDIPDFEPEASDIYDVDDLDSIMFDNIPVGNDIVLEILKNAIFNNEHGRKGRNHDNMKSKSQDAHVGSDRLSDFLDSMSPDDHVARDQQNDFMKSISHYGNVGSDRQHDFLKILSHDLHKGSHKKLDFSKGTEDDHETRLQENNGVVFYGGHNNVHIKFSNEFGKKRGEDAPKSNNPGIEILNNYKKPIYDTKEMKHNWQEASEMIIRNAKSTESLKEASTTGLKSNTGQITRDVLEVAEPETLNQ